MTNTYTPSPYILSAVAPTGKRYYDFHPSRLEAEAVADLLAERGWTAAQIVYDDGFIDVVETCDLGRYIGHIVG